MGCCCPAHWPWHWISIPYMIWKSLVVLSLLLPLWSQWLPFSSWNATCFLLTLSYLFTCCSSCQECFRRAEKTDSIFSLLSCSGHLLTPLDLCVPGPFEINIQMPTKAGTVGGLLCPSLNLLEINIVSPLPDAQVVPRNLSKC